MNKTISTILLLLLTVSAKAQHDKEYLSLANRAYDSGDKENAKIFYQKAAALNNPDAHFALAYKYVVTSEEAIYHYSEAAKMGHSEATSEVFEALFFRSSSLTMTNSELALEIYNQAKKQNTNLDFFNEENKVEAIKECIEARPLDVNRFIEKYKITRNDTASSDYAIWELAAEASRNGRFGAANPLLVLQLACKGGSIPAEKEMAVHDAYQNWKNNRIVVFDPCDYTSNNYGLAYCAQAEKEKAEKEYQNVIKGLSLQLKNNAGPMLRHAYEVTGLFIWNKAMTEEGHKGPGYSAGWARQSADSQKAMFLNLVKSINDGYSPSIDIQRDYDHELNETYKKTIVELRLHSIGSGISAITDHGVIRVQRDWIKYRDSAAKLFAKINSSLTEQQWKNYLTEIRIKQLIAINDLRK